MKSKKSCKNSQIVELTEKVAETIKEKEKALEEAKKKEDEKAEPKAEEKKKEQKAATNSGDSTQCDVPGGCGVNGKIYVGGVCCQDPAPDKSAKDYKKTK